jgi:excisionase family DNA binding protein
LNPRGLTVAEAAARAGISRSAMYRLVETRNIAYSRPLLCQIRIPVAAVEFLMERFLFEKRGKRGESGPSASHAGLALRALREVEGGR